MSNRLNNVELIGKLIGAVDVNTYSGKLKAAFTLLVPGAGDKNKETGYYDGGFFNVEAWAEAAEVIEDAEDRTLWKVTGALRQHRWPDRETGKPVTKLYISAMSIESVEVEDTSAPEPAPTPGKSKVVAASTKKAEKEKYDPFAEE